MPLLDLFTMLHNWSRPFPDLSRSHPIPSPSCFCNPDRHSGMELRKREGQRKRETDGGGQRTRSAARRVVLAPSLPPPLPLFAYFRPFPLPSRCRLALSPLS